MLPLGEPVEARVWEMVVVFVALGRGQLPGVAQVGKQGLVRALVNEASIEAFDEAILHRFSWLDIVPCDLAILLAFQDGVRCQLRPIIGDNLAGMETHPGNVDEFAANPLPRQGGVQDRCHAKLPPHDDVNSLIGSSGCRPFAPFIHSFLGTCP